MGSRPQRAPGRVDESAAQRVTERRWLPAALVTALILVVAGGGVTAAHITAGAAGAPVAVGAAVQVQPRAGWDLESRSDAPPFARFHRGPVLVDVIAYPREPAGPLAVAQRYVAESLRPGLASVSVGEPAATTIAGGVEAVRFGYVGITNAGVPVEGVVVAANGATAAAVFDAYGPHGALATVADDLRAMIEGAVVD